MPSFQDRVRAIQRDESLSALEKTRQIQSLFQARSRPVVSNWDQTCHHYENGCSQFVFSCCAVVDPCRRCHLERNTCDPKEVRVLSVFCNQCQKRCPVAPSCLHCGTLFAKNHCSLCFLWTNVDIYHCPDCGLCRKGSKESLYHCKQCQTCYLREEDGTPKFHNCRSSTASAIQTAVCCICMENLFTSTKDWVSLDCGHLMHRHCLETTLLQGNYQCPLCRKSVCNMEEAWSRLRNVIEEQPMPPNSLPLQVSSIVKTPFGLFCVKEMHETHVSGAFVQWNATATLARDVLSDPYRQIFCHDCEKTCFTPFHFHGLMCQHCRGFNTQCN